MKKRISWVISREDEVFFKQWIGRVKPDLMLEIGVAAGMSSAVALAAMAPWGGKLVSYDNMTVCGYEESLPVGFLVTERVPSMMDRWTLRAPATALEAGQEHAGMGIRLAFIDANHAHPYPTNDLVLLLPALCLEDCWVMLHDINLQVACPSYPDIGAKLLFDRWPGEKYRCGGRYDNIGVIRIQGWGDREDAAISALMDIPAQQPLV